MIAYFSRKDLKYKNTLLMFDYISTLTIYVFVRNIIIKRHMCIYYIYVS